MMREYMEAKYQEWIDMWLAEHAAGGYATCKEATTEMVKAFPELKRIAGHVYCAWGKRGHFWCEAPDGTVVDPTAAQFHGIFEYEPWVPGSEVRVGKCMNCGDEIWKAVQSLEESPGMASICSEPCEKEMVEYLGGRV